MAGVEDEDELKDALAAADRPPCSPKPASKSKPATGGGGAGLGRRLFASIPLPATLSAAIGRFSSPKPPTSNAGLGLGLLLDAGPAPSADGPSPATDAASGGSSVHLHPLAALQRQHGDDQVAGSGACVGEEQLGLVPAEEGWNTAEDSREKDGLIVDGCSANRNCFPALGQEEEGEQCPGDELGAAVAQDQEVVVEQHGANEDCAAVVEDESNCSAVEQCTVDEAWAVKDSDALEVNETVINQECAGGIRDEAKYCVSVGSQEEENAVVEEQGVDVISVQDQHEVMEQCAVDQSTTTTDGNAAQGQEVVVEQDGPTEWYTALEPVEHCSDDGSNAAKDGDIAEEEKGVEKEGAVGVLLDAAKDAAPVESQEDGDLVVAEQNEDAISSIDQHKVAEQSTGDQLRIDTDDNAVQDQDVVELEGETKCYYIAVEAVEQCSDDWSKIVKDGDIVEEKKGVEEESAVGILLDAAKDAAPVESQEDDDLVVAEQNEDVISSQDQHKVVEQCTSDRLRTGTDDDAVQDQEMVDLEGETECYTAVGAVEQCTNHGSSAAKDGNVVEEKEKAVEQEVYVGVLDVAKDCVTVESQEENVVVAEHGEDGMSVQDQHKVVEQCSSGQLRTTMDDNASEGQGVVEQEGAIFYMDSTTDDIAVKDQQKESDGDESRATRDENSVNLKDKVVDQEDVVDKHGVIKDVSGVELLENNVVAVEQGEDGISLSDEDITVELCTGDQLRATMDDLAAENQKAVEQEGDIVERVVTTDRIAGEDQEKEVEQSASDESRSTNDENGLEDKDVIDRQGVINDDSCVVAQEEGVVVAEQGRDAMSAGDEGNVVEQCTNDQMRATIEDNAAELQELMEQEDAIFEKGMTVGGITVEGQDMEVGQSAGAESSVTEDENAVEDNKKVDQEYAINRQGTAKDDSGVESQEEVNIMDPDQGVDDLSVPDEGHVVAQCTSDQLRTTMEDNAAELQEVVEQEGAIFEKGVALDGVTVEDQDKEMEQSAGDESRATKGENAVEDEKVYQEDAIDKQGAAKDGSGVESQEENMVVPDQGMDGLSVLDEGNVVPQGTNDQLSTTTDNAAVDPEVVEQEDVGSILGAAKVGIDVEESREEDIMVAEQVEDGVFIQDQDEALEQRTSDQLRTIADDNDVEDQEVHRENIGLSEGYPQRPGKLNCRFYMSTGSCSYGSSCHFNHPRIKAKLEVSSFPSEQKNHEAEFLELNRVGLPIREGARKCTYYMRNGTCRYGKKCCFNHPEQVLDVQLHTATGWDDTNLKSSPHSKKSPEHGTMDDKSSGSEILPPNILRMLLPPQNVPTSTEEREMRIKKDPDWGSASDDSDGCCSAESLDGPLCKQEHVDYPERPECPFLRRFGNCKFASSCQYYHPKDKFPSTYHPEDKFQSRYHPKEKSSRYHPKKVPALSELMVYLDRPGEPECPFYVKTGSCKFGVNCKFHHPKDITPSMQGPASPKRSVAANEHHPETRTTLQDQMYQQLKFPERPGQPDCRYYMQFGKCKFQSACIFNHPKDVLSSGWHPAECPFYMKTGTCQFGSACEFYHPKDRCSSRGGVIDGTDYGHDFATKSQNGLQQQEEATYPERPGELECPHYMKHGYCKFQMNCKFHHPRDRLSPKK